MAALVEIQMDEDEVFWARCGLCPDGGTGPTFTLDEEYNTAFSSDEKIVEELLKEHMEDVHGLSVDSFPFLSEKPR